jgi:hypothetical protein
MDFQFLIHPLVQVQEKILTEDPGWSLWLLEIVILEGYPMPGCDLNLTIPHDREAVGEANLACLGITHAFIEVVSDREEDQNPHQK